MNAVDLSHAGKIIMRCNNRSTLAKYWLSIDNNNNNDNNNDNNNNNKTVVCLCFHSTWDDGGETTAAKNIRHFVPIPAYLLKCACVCVFV